MSKDAWKQYFYDHTMLWMFFARTTKHRAVLVSNISGKFQLHTRDFETKETHQITNEPQGALFGSISSDGRFVYFLKDTDGNEHGHFVRIPFSGGDPVDITPDLPKYYSYGVSTDESGHTLCFIASLSDENFVYVVSFDVSGLTKEVRLIYQTKQSVYGAVMSPDGTHVGISCALDESPVTSQILFIENTSAKIVYSTKREGIFSPHAFSSIENLCMLGLSNMSGFYRPLLISAQSSSVEECAGLEMDGDMFVLDWIEKEKKMLLCYTHAAQHHLLVYDRETRTVQRIGPPQGGFDLFYESTGQLHDGSLLVRWYDFGHPPRVIQVISPAYTESTEVYALSSMAQTPRKLESVSFPSSDGTMIQMWIAKPDTTNTTPIPFIIEIHGGPAGIVNDEYTPEAQVWLDMGIGYCAVNYRGSLGFGKKFQEAIYGNPGHWEVEDIVAARTWLVENGHADSNRIVLNGWSWGGFVTLLALGTYPDLWIGGVAGTPITDCVMQYDDGPAYFKALDLMYFGGTPSEVPDIYIQSSPITYAKNFKAPILIIYGENDVRCPPRQILHFEHTLKEAGKSIVVEKFISGHAGEFANTDVRVSNFEKSVDFVKKILKIEAPAD